MPTNVIMPQLGESVVEGTVSKWLKREGDPVKEFDPLMEVNTDKVDTEVPAPASGTLLKVYVDEGVTASVAVSRTPSGVLNYHNAGKVQASSEPQDMRLQRMLGHLTTLIPANPKKVVVIGCGAGVTAGAVSIDPAVEQEPVEVLGGRRFG